MTSLLADKPRLQGSQRPSFMHLPGPSVGSAGDAAIELALMAGLELDPWQQLVLRESLGYRADGNWSAFEVGVVVPRQNGKGGITEARELAGLFLLGERLIIHSAHEFDTSLEAFRRLLNLIESNPELSSRVYKVNNAHGKEGLELKTGQRIRYRARTKGGGRGFTGDCLIFDEAMDFPESAHGALLPTLAARPNTQVWYTGSAVDQQVHDHGRVFSRIRSRANAGGDDALAYFEWSAAGDINDYAALARISVDQDAWAHANPGLGIRISTEHVGREQRSMDLRKFAVERLGIGDWPDLEDGLEDEAIIPYEVWAALATDDVADGDDGVYAVDVSPDRSSASISEACMDEDDNLFVRVRAQQPGVAWIAASAKSLGIEQLLYDEKSPTAAIVDGLRDEGVAVVPVSSRDHADACGQLVDAVVEKRLRHTGDPRLAGALAGAGIRPLGDAWAWSRRASNVDITPLVSCTLALWGLQDRSGEFVLEVFG